MLAGGRKLIGLLALGTVASAGCVAPPAEGEERIEQVGAAPAAISTSHNGATLLNSPSANLQNATAAWLKAEESVGGSQTPGTGLIAFTRTVGSGTRVGWARSTNWSVTSGVTWTVAQSDSTDPLVRWPAPDNVCEIYSGLDECGGSGGTWATLGTFGGQPEALWTGLDNVGAVVSTCGTQGDEDVCITTTIDGAASFTHSLILSVNDQDGFATGGAIDPASVHASLAWSPHRSSGIAGDVGLPIYVAWRNFNGPDGGGLWWFTRVVVGVSGTVAETTPPRQLDVVGNSSLDVTSRNRVHIFGTSLENQERMYIAFSEHPSSTVTCQGSTAPDPSESVSWYVSESDDLGAAWNCFTGLEGSCFPSSANGKTLLTSDSTWQNCVGPTRTAAGGGSTVFRTINDSRPAVAVNVAANGNEGIGDYPNQHFYFAVGKTLSSKQRIHVYRAGGLTLLGSDSATSFQLMTTSPDESGLVDSFAPAMTAMQRLGAENSRGAFVWRNGFATTFGIRGQDWRDKIATSATVLSLVFNVTTTNSAFENVMGPRVGIATFQGCANDSIEGCPGGTIGLWPNLPFFAAWPDGRSTGTNYDVMMRGFKL